VALIAKFTNAGARTPLGAWFSRLHVWVYRRTGGWLLRRTGVRRVTPMIYLMADGVPVVMPANAGARPPVWWLNLRTVGSGIVQIGRIRARVEPRVLEGAEYVQVYQRFRRTCRSADDYARFAGRRLPLVALHPVLRLNRTDT
jgi:deazaflavin-dependent oxidoreductase (nitroreductase family)